MLIRAAFPCFVYLLLPVRKRNRPRVSSGLPCVRARFDAVEMPLNRIKKSMKARMKPFLLSVTIRGNLSTLHRLRQASFISFDSRPAARDSRRTRMTWLLLRKISSYSASGASTMRYGRYRLGSCSVAASPIPALPFRNSPPEQPDRPAAGGRFQPESGAQSHAARSQ